MKEVLQKFLHVTKSEVNDFMKVIKKINNNAAICIDSLGNEIVAIGTGIGFPSIPYDIVDLSVIQRSFYDVDSNYLNVLNQISDELFKVTIKIVDMFKNKINDDIGSNIVFTLADHIDFALSRYKKNIKMDYPLQYDIQYMYELEYEIGQQALKLINRELNVRLPKEEASNIALHLVNARVLANNKGTIEVDSVIKDVTDIIGESFQIFIDKNTFSFSRFATHFQYLIKRQSKGQTISTENVGLYESVVKDYPKTAECVEKIKEYLKEELNFTLSEEETLYLILHVNRLCSKEDCYRKGITPIQ